MLSRSRQRSFEPHVLFMPLARAALPYLPHSVAITVPFSLTYPGVVTPLK